MIICIIMCIYNIIFNISYNIIFKILYNIICKIYDIINMFKIHSTTRSLGLHPLLFAEDGRARPGGCPGHHHRRRGGPERRRSTGDPRAGPWLTGGTVWPNYELQMGSDKADN